MSQKVRDLAATDTGLGTVGGEKADLVWSEACDNLDMNVSDFARMVPVSESHIRHCLKEMSPSAFGL